MPRSFRSTCLSAALSASLVALFSTVANADALKEAEKLYAAAAKDMAAGDYARACPKFEAAREKAPDHVRTGMTLAQCYENWGRLGSAFEELQRVRALAVLQNKADKVTTIDEQLAKLEKSAPKLAIRVSSEIKELADLSILREGKIVPMAQWDVAVPVNPGKYRIEATALGKDPWTTSVDVKEPGKTVMVIVSPPSWGLVEHAGTSNGVSGPGASSSKMRVAGFVGVGLGAAGFAVGGILGGLAISKNKEGATYCNAQNACRQAGYDLRLDAFKLGNGSTAAFIVGAAFLGGGVLLVGLAPSSKSTLAVMPGVHIETWVGLSSIGVRGRW